MMAMLSSMHLVLSLVVTSSSCFRSSPFWSETMIERWSTTMYLHPMTCMCSTLDRTSSMSLDPKWSQITTRSLSSVTSKYSRSSSLVYSAHGRCRGLLAVIDINPIAVSRLGSSRCIRPKAGGSLPSSTGIESTWCSNSLRIEVLPMPVLAVTTTNSDRRRPNVLSSRPCHGYGIVSYSGGLAMSSHRSLAITRPAGVYAGAAHHSFLNSANFLFIR